MDSGYQYERHVDNMFTIWPPEIDHNYMKYTAYQNGGLKVFKINNLCIEFKLEVK